MGSTRFDTDDGDVIQTIKDSVRPEILKIGDEEFISRSDEWNVERAPKEPLVGGLQVATLTALADYLNHEVDQSARQSVAIHVVSPTRVDILKQVNNDIDRRFTPIVASADVPTINLLHTYVSQEEAIIELQAKFVDAERRADLLKSLGTIVLEDELRQADDGITQEFTTRSGIDRATDSLENPVALRPFRTFVDIDQPSSPFVVRLKKNDLKLSICLFEADGGKWRNEARQSIKAFLAENLKEEYAILA